MSELVDAADEGNLEKVKTLLSEGVDPKQTDPETTYFPLLVASRHGYIDIVKELLKSPKIDPNQLQGNFPMTSLDYAVLGNHFVVVTELLEAGADPNITNPFNGQFSLFLAAERGFAFIIKELLEFGAKPNQVNPTTLYFPLLVASEKGHIRAVKELLKSSKIKVNKFHSISGYKSLDLAAMEGYVLIVTELLNAGAKPNSISSLSGYFPLLSASKNGFDNVVKVLLQHKADPDLWNPFTGEFPLLAAVLNNDIITTEELLKNGANPDKENSFTGIFPLLIAVLNNNIIMVEKLMEYGANPSKQYNGRDLLDIFNEEVKNGDPWIPAALHRPLIGDRNDVITREKILHKNFSGVKLVAIQNPNHNGVKIQYHKGKGFCQHVIQKEILIGHLKKMSIKSPCPECEIE